MKEGRVFLMTALPQIASYKYFLVDRLKLVWLCLVLAVCLKEINMMSLKRFYCYKCPRVVVGRWVYWIRTQKYPMIINGMFDDPVYIPGVMGVIFVFLFTIHNYFLSIRSMPFSILIALMLTGSAVEDTSSVG